MTRERKQIKDEGRVRQRQTILNEYKSMHSIRVYRNLIPICQLRDFGAWRGTLEPGSMEATDEQNAIQSVEALKSAMV